MYYLIRHHTRFRYSAPITESVMEVRMRPRTEGLQRCHEFSLNVWPRAHVTHHLDFLGNTVHHFNIPRRHAALTIKTEATVEVQPPSPLPDTLGELLNADPWQALDAQVMAEDFWDMLNPSRFAQPTPLLDEFAREIDWQRGDDPLTLLRRLNHQIYASFEYKPQSTDVDSPIDDALQQRSGVCQDYSHIMIALARSIGIPCRYVSGYLFHRTEDHDRSAEDATHAWVEAYLPELGWVGFDPTNDLLALERHIRVAVGRDYADVPPTRGVFKGQADSELDVGVQVTLTDAPATDEPLLPDIAWDPSDAADALQQQQQQQQQ